MRMLSEPKSAWRICPIPSRQQRLPDGMSGDLPHDFTCNVLRAHRNVPGINTTRLGRRITIINVIGQALDRSNYPLKVGSVPSALTTTVRGGAPFRLLLGA